LVRDFANYSLRWFTPKVEVPLCGHAKLASAAVVMERLEPARDEVIFATASGPLTVRREDALYAMNLPERPSKTTAAPAGLADALGIEPVEVLVNRFNYMAVLPNEGAVRGLAPDISAIAKMDRPGVIATATGKDGYDFISRYFAPAKGIPEDPVTGAAHCMLAPYWAKRLGKDSFRAFQASPRGGEVHCRLVGERVELKGGCVFYLEGFVDL
jgi:PhzF family phenazine biosynthesis protein